MRTFFVRFELYLQSAARLSRNMAFKSLIAHVYRLDTSGATSGNYALAGSETLRFHSQIRRSGQRAL